MDICITLFFLPPTHWLHIGHSLLIAHHILGFNHLIHRQDLLTPSLFTLSVSDIVGNENNKSIDSVPQWSWRHPTLALSWKPVYSITIDLLLLITTQIIVLSPPPHLLEYISCSLSIAWLQLVIGFMFEALHYKEKPGIIQMKHPGLRLRPYVTLRFVSVKLIALATRKPIHMS